MVNHVRTLLLNLRGGVPAEPDLPGEEYVPPGYVPPSLPAELLRVRAALFGADPDRAMLNYRLHQLLTAAHASAYAHFLTALDPRVSYLPLASLRAHPLFAGSVEQTTGTARALRLLGEPGSTDGRRLLHEWLVTTDGATVTTTRIQPGRQTTTAADAGVPLTLPGGGQYLLATGGAAGWRVRALARPAVDLAGLPLEIDRLAEDDLSRLFSAGAGHEAFGNLWSDEGAPTPERLTGVVLALAYQTDAVWRTGRPLWTS